MRLLHLFSACVFSHADDPVIVLHGKVMHHECRRCQADLGPVLAGQKFKARKAKAKKRKSADVLRLERKRA